MTTEVNNEATQKPLVLCSLVEVAEILNLNNSLLTTLCRYGVINAVRDRRSNKVLGITEEELERIKKLPRGRGEGCIPHSRIVRKAA